MYFIGSEIKHRKVVVWYNLPSNGSDNVCQCKCGYLYCPFRARLSHTMNVPLSIFKRRLVYSDRIRNPFNRFLMAFAFDKSVTINSFTIKCIVWIVLYLELWLFRICFDVFRNNVPDNNRNAIKTFSLSSERGICSNECWLCQGKITHTHNNIYGK